MKAWIGVDLDGTLAHYDGWRGVEHIGTEIPAMVTRIKQWLAQGHEVRIFTARVSVAQEGCTIEQIRGFIEDWTKAVFGVVLQVTCCKDFGMVELWDDRCVRVKTNSGERCCE